MVDDSVAMLILNQPPIEFLLMMQLYLRELKVDILALCDIYFFEFPAIHFEVDFDILIVYNILHLKSSDFKILIL